MASSFKTSDYVSMINEIAPGTVNETGINLDLKELPHLKSIFIINKDTNTNIDSFEHLVNSKQTSSISDIELIPMKTLIFNSLVEPPALLRVQLLPILI